MQEKSVMQFVISHDKSGFSSKGYNSKFKVLTVRIKIFTIKLFNFNLLTIFFFNKEILLLI